MESVYVCSNCNHKSAFYLSECPRCQRDLTFRDSSHEPAKPPAPPPPPVTREPRTCHNYWCDYETSEPTKRCPKCGRAMYTRAEFRQLGWLLFALGGLIAAFMAAVMCGAAYLFARAGEPGMPPAPAGPWAKAVVFGVTGLVFVLGLTFAAAGLSQARSGRRSRPLMNFAIGLVVALLALYGVVKIVVGLLD